MTDRVLTRRELNRSILARQGLLRRERRPALGVIEQLVGMQAQEPPDPYVALWSRVEGFEPMELSRLLLDRRAVRIVTLMRTTIHLVSAGDALRIRPVVQPVAERAWRSSGFARQLAGLDLGEVLAAGRELLAERPHAARELGRRLAERWPDHDPQALGYAVRFLVPLVQVPPRGIWGQKAAPVLDTVAHWLGQPLDPAPSVDDVVRRYLAAFGPATVRDIAIWSWLTGLREVVERMRPGLVTYRDDRGRELFDVPDAPFPDPDAPASVRFLPQYDNLLLSHDDRSRVIAPEDRGRTYWRGSVLVDGFVAGTWRIGGGEDRRLQIGLYRQLPDAWLAEVAEEGAGLLAFHDIPDGRVDFQVLDA